VCAGDVPAIDGDGAPATEFQPSSQRLDYGDRERRIWCSPVVAIRESLLVVVCVSAALGVDREPRCRCLIKGSFLCEKICTK
ncbi:MAG TPA: hypothetical protein VIN00_07905, partial [Candidatus Dormibacteraeota bacterium]